VAALLLFLAGAAFTARAGVLARPTVPVGGHRGSGTVCRRLRSGWSGRDRRAILGVNIALLLRDSEECPAFDRDGSNG
jgi:hypothetical protein